MKVFIYEIDGVVCVGSTPNNENIEDIANLSVPVGVKYLILDSLDLPKEPQESWYIEDGQIKIDQQKLVEFNRKNMPTLTPIEFDIKLVDAGLYDQVQELIKDSFELRIAYNRATFFSRTDPFIDQARIALGLTDEQVDMIWESSLV